ncbi:MAG: rRNA maturation RNase YbeY [Nitrospirae bacterium]|nr:rRNA maturation RNase YbeY [Nitrospirota bacterium]
MRLKGAQVSIVFVSPKRMRSLNLSYRGIDRTTDVLSFGVTSPDEAKKTSRIPYILGDIVINPSQAKTQAKGHELSFKEELRWLIVHGLLHLIGYKHETRYAERKMRRKERQLLERLNAF